MFGRKKPEVLVVGAGPVGLFTALSLARRGVQVQIVDKEWRTAAHAYGLALHASTLKLLEEAGLLGNILDKAYRIRTIGLYDGADRQAEMRPADLSEDFSFLAVMRQDVLEGLLEDALKPYGVKVLWNHRVAQLEHQADHVIATVDKLTKGSTGYAVAHTEWEIAKTKEFDVPFVIGADGHQSDVRRALDIDYTRLGPPLHFAVFEFHTDADLHHEMRIVLDDESTNVLWPLPGGGARWSFQLLDFEETTVHPRRKDRFEVQIGGSHFPVLSGDHLHAFIEERAPWFTGSVDEIDWRLAVRFEQRLAEAFGKNRMWLVGDAGHMTGPVGIQSMNVGLREAHDLAALIADILHHGGSMDDLDAYNQQRLAEWRFLLGQEGSLKAGSQATPWIAQRADRLLPCLPASGEDLNHLAHQIGLDVEGVTTAV